MSMFRTHLSRTALVGLLFALTCFMMPRLAEAASNNNMENPQIRNLLHQAAQQADVLDYDADQMTGLLESDVNWQLHASMLTQVRAHVNALGETLAKLQADRNLGNQWQQRAISTPPCPCCARSQTIQPMRLIASIKIRLAPSPVNMRTIWRPMPTPRMSWPAL